MEFAGLENDGQENVGLNQYGLTLRCLEYILLTASLLLYRMAQKLAQFFTP